MTFACCARRASSLPRGRAIRAGEQNRAAINVAVHQFDAHSLGGSLVAGARAGVSVDPTFKVASERIERGLQDAMQGEGSLSGRLAECRLPRFAISAGSNAMRPGLG